MQLNWEPLTCGCLWKLTAEGYSEPFGDLRLGWGQHSDIVALGAESISARALQARLAHTGNALLPGGSSRLT